jgi:hypothetical protein
MGIKEGEEIQAKGTGNIFKRTTAENFPNIEKECHPGTGSFQNTKLERLEKKHP